MSERKPLTLEELRKMDGKPLFVECLNPQKYICPPVGCRILSKSITGRFGVWDGENCLIERDYGTDWIAYSYEPPLVDRSEWKCGICEVPTHWVEWCKLGYEYCPHCGRPLTDAAWEMVEKRLGVQSDRQGTSAF